MKTIRISFLLVVCCVVGSLTSSCYKETNPWDGLVTVKGPVAVVRSQVVAPTTQTAGSPVTLTIVFSTFEKPVTKLNLYATVGATGTRTLVGTTAISDASPKLDRYTRMLTYTVPAGTAAATRILLAVGIVTEGDNEVFTGNMTLTTR